MESGADIFMVSEYEASSNLRPRTHAIFETVLFDF